MRPVHWREGALESLALEAKALEKSPGHGTSQRLVVEGLGFRVHTHFFLISQDPGVWKELPDRLFPILLPVYTPPLLCGNTPPPHTHTQTGYYIMKSLYYTICKTLNPRVS